METPRSNEMIDNSFIDAHPDFYLFLIVVCGGLIADNILNWWGQQRVEERAPYLDAFVQWLEEPVGLEIIQEISAIGYLTGF